jgi:hypothetical protein
MVQVSEIPWAQVLALALALQLALASVPELGKL